MLNKNTIPGRILKPKKHNDLSGGPVVNVLLDISSFECVVLVITCIHENKIRMVCIIKNNIPDRTVC